MMRQGDCENGQESQTSTQRSVVVYFKESNPYAVRPCVRLLVSEHDRNQVLT